jgi:vacuolar-type H+-ATPase subunit H
MKRDPAKSGLAAGSSSVDHAINRVLAAEAGAREAIAACEREATDLISEAEARCRAIAHRAERRMQRAQRIAERGIERALAELRSPLPAAEFRAPLADDRRVVHVATSLADELTRFESLAGATKGPNVGAVSRSRAGDAEGS